MKKGNKILAAFLTVTMTLTSIQSIYAENESNPVKETQDVEEIEEVEQEESTEEAEQEEIVEEVTDDKEDPFENATALEEGLGAYYTVTSELKYFSFTPTRTVTYLLKGMSEQDIVGYLYDSLGNEIPIDDSKDLNNGIQCSLQANTTYYIGVKTQNDADSVNVQFNISRLSKITVKYYDWSTKKYIDGSDFTTNLTITFNTATGEDIYDYDEGELPDGYSYIEESSVEDTENGYVAFTYIGKEESITVNNETTTKYIKARQQYSGPFFEEPISATVDQYGYLVSVDESTLPEGYLWAGGYGWSDGEVYAILVPGSTTHATATVNYINWADDTILQTQQDVDLTIKDQNGYITYEYNKDSTLMSGYSYECMTPELTDDGNYVINIYLYKYADTKSVTVNYLLNYKTYLSNSYTIQKSQEYSSLKENVPTGFMVDGYSFKNGEYYVNIYAGETISTTLHVNIVDWVTNNSIGTKDVSMTVTKCVGTQPSYSYYFYPYNVANEYGYSGYQWFYNNDIKENNGVYSATLYLFNSGDTKNQIFCYIFNGSIIDTQSIEVTASSYENYYSIIKQNVPSGYNYTTYTKSNGIYYVTVSKNAVATDKVDVELYDLNTGKLINTIQKSLTTYENNEGFYSYNLPKVVENYAGYCVETTEEGNIVSLEDGKYVSKIYVYDEDIAQNYTVDYCYQSMVLERRTINSTFSDLSTSLENNLPDGYYFLGFSIVNGQIRCNVDRYLTNKEEGTINYINWATGEKIKESETIEVTRRINYAGSYFTDTYSAVSGKAQLIDGFTYPATYQTVDENGNFVYNIYYYNTHDTKNITVHYYYNNELIDTKSLPSAMYSVNYVAQSNIPDPDTYQYSTYSVEDFANSIYKATLTKKVSDSNTGSESTTTGSGSATYGSGSATYGSGSATYGSGSATYGSGSATYGSGSATYGSGSATYGSGSATYGSGSATYGSGSATYGSGSATYGSGSATYGSGSATYGSDDSSTTIKTGGSNNGSGSSTYYDDLYITHTTSDVLPGDTVQVQVKACDQYDLSAANFTWYVDSKYSQYSQYVTITQDETDPTKATVQFSKDVKVGDLIPIDVSIEFGNTIKGATTGSTVTVRSVSFLVTDTTYSVSLKGLDDVNRASSTQTSTFKPVLMENIYKDGIVTSKVIDLKDVDATLFVQSFDGKVYDADGKLLEKGSKNDVSANQTFTVTYDPSVGNTDLYVGLFYSNISGYKSCVYGYTEFMASEEFPTCQLDGYSLSLSEDIGVNFFMNLDDSIAEDDTSYMEFTLPNGTNLDVKIAQALKSSNGDYVFTCDVAAKDMNSTIKAQLYSKNEKVGKEYSYAVKDYVDYIVSHASDYDEKDVNVVKTMMDYGNYTQQYFGYKTDNLSDPYNALNEDLDLSEYAYTSKNSDTVSFVGARLVLTSKPGLKLYFKGSGDFQVDGEDVETSTEGKYTVVIISDITNIYKFYSVTCDTCVVSYSIASYGNIALKGTNDSLKNLIKSMVAYYNLF